MKRFKLTLLSILAVAVFLLSVACGGGSKGDDDKTTKEAVDYVSSLKLDMSSNTKKQEVTIRLHVDGDTTHFDPKLNSTIATNPASDFASTEGYIKARYIAIDTPESTGVIEEWGGKAALFTRKKLDGAESIIVESDNDKWNIDSSGSHRYVVWVWYKTRGESEYRNLNVEILQEGLARGSAVSTNRYGSIANNAMMQSMDLKRYVFSTDKDPDFPYGEAKAVTLKELRCNIADYYNSETKSGTKVKVEGVIVSEFNNSVYIEDFDADSGVYFGMPVYYGYNPGALRSLLKIGNRLSFVGVVAYWEAGDTYQITDVKYNEYDPTLASNTTLVSKDNELAFTEVKAKELAEGKLTVNLEKKTVDENGDTKIEAVQKELNYAEAIMSTSVTVKNLKVTDIYTTKKGDSAGAMTITCESLDDGATVIVRTEVLKDDDGNIIEEGKYNGKTITVKGIIDKYEGDYQVKVYRADFITIHD